MKLYIKPKPLYQIKTTYQTIYLFDMLFLTIVKIGQVLKTKKKQIFSKKLNIFYK